MTFEETLELLPEDYSQQSFSLTPFIKKAQDLNGGHSTIISTLNYLEGQNIDPVNFHRNTLLKVWKEEDTDIHIKIILTMWWGGINHQHQAPKFYTTKNLDNLQSRSADIEKDLKLTASELKEGNLKGTLQKLFTSFELGSNKLDGISMAFYSKIFQFYFYAHATDNKAILPIIADQWSMKAVLCDMLATESDWKSLFRKPNKNYGYNPSFKGSPNTKFKYYESFVNYFHGRAKDLIEKDIVSSSFELEEKVFGKGRDKNNPQNPRYHYERTLQQYFG